MVGFESFPDIILYGRAGGAGLLIDSFWIFLVSRACLEIGLAGVLAGIIAVLDRSLSSKADRIPKAARRCFRFLKQAPFIFNLAINPPHGCRVRPGFLLAPAPEPF